MSMRARLCRAAIGLAVLVLATSPVLARPGGGADGRVKSADGVEIAYSMEGSGQVALVFVHGAFADRTFWKKQLSGLSDRFTVVALDLGGHGDSGRNRKAWTLAAWAEDVRAVVEALHLSRVVLIGNSLGGPVALEAAALLKGRVLGVVGVDTLHDASQVITKADARERADAFRKDFKPACHALVDTLFHPGTQQELHAWVEGRMCAMPPDIAAGMMEGMGGFDLAAAFRKAGVPIRAINGDLFPMNLEGNRKIAPDFQAVVMDGAGHYPQLERPEEFNLDLIAIVKGLEKSR